MINSFLGVTAPASPSLSSLSNEELVSVLTCGMTFTIWSVNGILAASLRIKYEILHKIGIANWFPSFDASSVSAALAMLLYRIGTGSSVDSSLFNHT